LFLDISSCVKFGSASNDRGICPDNSFICNSTLFKWDVAPSKSCIGPESSLYDRSRYCSIGMVKIDVGISPAQRREIWVAESLCFIWKVESASKVWMKLKYALRRPLWQIKTNINISFLFFLIWTSK
jgi:hypothetical protein